MSQDARPPCPITFDYHGTHYRLPGNAYPCWLICLPNGQLLQIGGWLHSLPPRPVDLTPIAKLPGGSAAAKVAVAQPLGSAPRHGGDLPADRPDLPEIHVDWTIDPTIGRCNSSEAFVRLEQAVAELLRHSLPGVIFSDDGPDDMAGLIVAQLAHVHHLAPANTVVESATKTTPGNLFGYFTWNGRMFRYTAEQVADDGAAAT